MRVKHGTFMYKAIIEDSHLRQETWIIPQNELQKFLNMPSYNQMIIKIELIGKFFDNYTAGSVK